MKTELTTEQSAHLIELGVPREMASGIDIDNFDNMVLLAAEAMANGNRDKTIRSLSSPIFKLTDLLEILPKEFIPNKNNEYDVFLDIQILNDSCVVSYEYRQLFQTFECKIAKELIDALYELAVWCLDRKYLKFD